MMSNNINTISKVDLLENIFFKPLFKLLGVVEKGKIDFDDFVTTFDINTSKGVMCICKSVSSIVMANIFQINQNFIFLDRPLISNT